MSQSANRAAPWPLHLSKEEAGQYPLVVAVSRLMYLIQTSQSSAVSWERTLNLTSTDVLLADTALTSCALGLS